MICTVLKNKKPVDGMNHTQEVSRLMLVPMNYSICSLEVDFQAHLIHLTCTFIGPDLDGVLKQINKIIHIERYEIQI